MLHDHPHRQAILEEVHARPIIIIPESCRLRRLVYLPESAYAGISPLASQLRQWCAQNDLPQPQKRTRQHSFVPQNNDVHQAVWEFHNEFITVTWTSDLSDNTTHPHGIGLEVIEDHLKLVCATRIDVLAEKMVPQRVIDTFKISSLCHASVEDHKGEIATDFIEDNDGFVRFEFAAAALNPLRRSILARRLFELESYSKLALLGLPPVREAADELMTLEAAISAAIREVPDIGGIDLARAAIASLNTLSLQTAALTDRLDYRIAASQAYGQIVEDRLSALRDAPTGIGSSVSVYISNRVQPAIRTLKATEKRLSRAAERIERTAMMLNARNGLELEFQNREILETISKTSRSQFRLQQTVEGLSVIAITYYLVGILSYALSAPLHALEWNKEWVMAGITPAALLIVWMTSRRFWARHGE